MDADGKVKELSASRSETKSDTQVDLVSSAVKYETSAKEETAEWQRCAEIEKTAMTGDMSGDAGSIIAGSSPSPSPPTKSHEAGKKESAGHDSSKQLAGSSKLEDQINLQHLVELMKIFYVSKNTVTVCCCIDLLGAGGG